MNTVCTVFTYAPVQCNHWMLKRCIRIESLFVALCRSSQAHALYYFDKWISLVICIVRNVVSLTFIFETETLLEISCEQLSVSVFYLSECFFICMKLSLPHTLRYQFKCYISYSVVFTFTLVSFVHLIHVVLHLCCHLSSTVSASLSQWTMQRTRKCIFHSYRLCRRLMNVFGVLQIILIIIILGE